MSLIEPGSSAELANLMPSLRDDLRFTLQKHDTQTCYLVEDEKNSRFYRIGIPEYTLISLFDGTTSVREALAQTAAVLGPNALTAAEAASICRWLIHNQLAYTAASSEVAHLSQRSQRAATSELLNRLNPVIFRLPLLHPQRFIDAAARYFGWWFTWPALAIWLALGGLAIQQAAAHGHRASANQGFLFARGNLLLLVVTWGLLKTVHELAHGIACRRFGGQVREAGLLFVLLAPHPYVDVTSSWRFASKWKRACVAAAGMYAELFVASLATLVWVHTQPGLVHQQAYNTLVTAGFVTLLFNANPLMRFDGYYILSDLTGIPNLYGLGQQYLRYLGKRYVLAVRVRPPQWPWLKAQFIRCYATLALIWRMLVGVCLLLAAAALFGGAGIVLAIVAAATWLCAPVYRFANYVRRGHDRPQLGRLTAIVAVSTAAVIGTLLLPEPGGVRAPGVVRYKPLHTLRAPHAGFVREVALVAGAVVNEGEVLVVIENHDLQTELADLELERELSIRRTRQYQNDRDVAAIQVEDKLRSALEARIDERRRQVTQSAMRAPASGTVLDQDPQSLLGTYVEEGQLLVSIGQEQHKELQLWIDQADVRAFSANRGAIVDVVLRSPRFRPFACRLGRVDPRATRRLDDAALGAACGGPLSVQPTSQAEPLEDAWQLVEPRFISHVRLSPEQACTVRAGQRASVRLHHSRGTIGQVAMNHITDWIRQRLDRARGRGTS
jgi:putative peptide zinc metalloprotease protein